MNNFFETQRSTNPEPLFMSQFVDLEQIVIEKLRDAMTPALEVELTPEEAEIAGAFSEEALSEADAVQSAGDSAELADAASPAVS